MYIPAWPSLDPKYLFKSETAAELPFPLNGAQSTYFYVARNGIFQLFRRLGFGKGDVVLAPDYHHGNEIYAIRAAGVSIQYYPVQRNLDVDLDALRRLCQARPKALYVTHFIGWPQPMDEIRALCREYNVMLIEDCALSFMSSYKGVPLGTSGDYSVFCLYKTLPLPNGGVLVENRPSANRLSGFDLVSANTVSVAARSFTLMIQWLRMHNETFGKALFSLKRRTAKAMNAANVNRVPVGNTGFDVNSANIAMSPLSKKLIPRFQYDEIKRVRQRNFRFLWDRLCGDVPLLPKAITEDVCPLFFPLLVKDKAAAAEKLWEHGVEVVQFWNGGDPEAQRNGFPAQFLRRHVLEVPIHQDVSLEHLDYTAKLVKDMKLYLPRAA